MSDELARQQATTASVGASARDKLNAILSIIRRNLGDMLRPPTAPPRAASAIHEAEGRAEIFVGYVQLAGVITFAALYGLSRAAFSAGGGFEPVPLMLVLYAGFVVWRLRMALRGKLTLAILTVSTVADVGVLMGAIWSFTIQYDAPGALYLKAPTLLYVFTLIALRALRFDPRQVLLSGVVAALGWIILVFLAAFGDEPAPLTSDYPTYMTSLSLLWGAEAEKVLAILAATVILALVVARARTLLIRTSVETDAATDLARFLDRNAARRVRQAETALEAGDGELKPAAIMFIDLRGFSAAAAAMDARDVIKLLEEYQSRFVPVVEAAGGSIDKFLGDGILISFGTAASSGREAADALAVIPALLGAADLWARDRKARGDPPLDVAVALTTGEVVHGVVGYGDRLEFTVIGDAVNLAAKLEKHAKVENARVIATLDVIQRGHAQGQAATPTRIVRAACVEGVSKPIDLAVLA